MTNALVQRWLEDLRYRSSSSSSSHAVKDFPDYSGSPETLVTTANVHDIDLGTGFSIYQSYLLPAIESAEDEVILVTCFWARSSTLTALGDALKKLSAKTEQRGGRKIRVRICFSSLSLFQKLFHTTDLRGTTYPPSQWVTKLGLPDSKELSGLDLSIKSVFVRPFSVLHPKFVVIDRRHVLLPSCNVSWEDWFEGCIGLSGNITASFLDFWSRTWANKEDKDSLMHALDQSKSPPLPASRISSVQNPSQNLASIDTIFLPSSHHVNPQFSFWPWKPCPAPPPTPLNTFLLAAFADARETIYIQTPNLTSPPVLSALLSALERGVNVEILTSERLMILEQLVTAGTTTVRCVQKLIRCHKGLVGSWDSSTQTDLEAGRTERPGRLSVSYYQPYLGVPDNTATIAEPVQSHLKLTVVDGEWSCLGSGNMDRASWFGSQELGVVFHSKELASNIKSRVEAWTSSRKKSVYDSE